MALLQKLLSHYENHGECIFDFVTTSKEVEVGEPFCCDTQMMLFYFPNMVV